MSDPTHRAGPMPADRAPSVAHARLACYELAQARRAVAPLFLHPWERGLDPRATITAQAQQACRGSWPVAALPADEATAARHLAAVALGDPSALRLDRDVVTALTRAPASTPVLVGLAVAAHTALVGLTQAIVQHAADYPPPPPDRVIADAMRRTRWPAHLEARLPDPVLALYRAAAEVAELQGALHGYLLLGRSLVSPRGWVTLLRHCTGSARLAALAFLASCAEGRGLGADDATAALDALLADAPPAWWTSFTEDELLAVLQSPYAPLRAHAGRDGVVARTPGAGAAARPRGRPIPSRRATAPAPPLRRP